MKYVELTEEQISFLKSYDGRTRKEAFVDFNMTFNLDIPLSTLKTWMQRLGIKSSGSGRFDGTQTPWAKGLSKEEFWSRYSEESRQRMINAPKEANRTAKIGNVRIKDGIPYICVSVNPSVPKEKRRAPLRRVVWEKHYGTIPQDHMIIHLNGNVLDCRINNLAMIPKSYRPMVLRYIKSNDPEVRKLAIKYCDLLSAIEEARNGHQTESNRV